MQIPEVDPHHCEMLEENEAIQWSKRPLASCPVCCELWTVSEMRKTATFLERKLPAKDIHRFENMKQNVRYSQNWSKLKNNNKISGKIKYQFLNPVFHFFPQGFSKKFRHDGLREASKKVKSGQQPVSLVKQYENREGKWLMLLDIYVPGREESPILWKHSCTPEKSHLFWKTRN